MSGYACYEFLAIDRPLTEAEMDELGDISSRAQLTPTKLRCEYNYGDFGGDAEKLLAEHFDVHFYFDNWGTRQLMLRLPKKHVSAKQLAPYIAGTTGTLSATKQHVIVELCNNDEGHGGFVEEEEYCLSALAPIRAELLRGDLRPAYLAWLLALQSEHSEEVAEDAVEPPVPPGLAELTLAQQALVEFLRIDGDLLAAAAAGSPALLDDGPAFERWVQKLSAGAKSEWLKRAVKQPDLPLGEQLLRAFRQQMPAKSSDSARRATELLAAAESRREERRVASVRKRRVAGRR